MLKFRLEELVFVGDKFVVDIIIIDWFYMYNKMFGPFRAGQKVSACFKAGIL